MKIFVSSTFEDLRDYREAAIRALRQMGHDVVAMEDFTASNAPPVERVLQSVRACQAYVGIFAWRYGYLPQQPDIPARLKMPPGFEVGTTSITHLEYLEAKAQRIEILAFLLDETVPWPPRKIDAFVAAGRPTAEAENKRPPGSGIQTLRQSLKRERIVSFFGSPSDLEARVATAVTNLGLTLQIATNLEGLTQPVPPPVPDSSTHGRIRDEVRSAQTSNQRTVTVDLLQEWWLTRLYLLAALVSRFTEIQRIVFVKGGGDTDFVGMLSVRAVLERLPYIDTRLTAFASELDGLRNVHDQDTALDRALELWDQEVQDLQRHVLVTSPNLSLWFGETLFRQPVQVRDLAKSTLLDIVQVLAYPNDFVPVVTRPGAMEEIRSMTKQSPESEQSPEPASSALPIAVIDKRALNDQLAQRHVDELMERARLR